jgi:hypothetical protein
MNDEILIELGEVSEETKGDKGHDIEAGVEDREPN